MFFHGGFPAGTIRHPLCRRDVTSSGAARTCDVKMTNRL